MLLIPIVYTVSIAIFSAHLIKKMRFCCSFSMALPYEKAKVISQNAMAGGFLCCGVEMDAEEAEAAEASNTTLMTNHTANSSTT